MAAGVREGVGALTEPVAGLPIGAGREEEAGDVDVPMPRRQVQRRLPASIACLHGHPVLEEQARRGEVSELGRDVQRGAAATLFDGDRLHGAQGRVRVEGLQAERTHGACSWPRGRGTHAHSGGPR